MEHTERCSYKLTMCKRQRGSTVVSETAANLCFLMLGARRLLLGLKSHAGETSVFPVPAFGRVCGLQSKKISVERIRVSRSPVSLTLDWKVVEGQNILFHSNMSKHMPCSQPRNHTHRHTCTHAHREKKTSEGRRTTKYVRTDKRD